MGKEEVSLLRRNGWLLKSPLLECFVLPHDLGQNSQPQPQTLKGRTKGVTGKKGHKGNQFQEQAMDGDRPKPLDGPRDAADFLSPVCFRGLPPPPYVEGDIFTCPWMASMSGVEGGSCLTAPVMLHSN